MTMPPKSAQRPPSRPDIGCGLKGARKIGLVVVLFLSLARVCEVSAVSTAPRLQGRGCPAEVRLSLRGGGKAKAKAPAFKTAPIGDTCTVTSSLRLQEMSKFPKDAKIAEAGLADLWRICLNAEKQKRIGAFKGGCKAAVSALQIHYKDATVMKEALSFVANLAYAQPNIPMGPYGWAHLINQDELGRMGAVRLVIGAMKEHRTTENIQQIGARALANLAYNHTTNAAHVVRWEGIEAVLEGMRIHKDSLMVQEAGCLFLWSCLISVKNATHITYGYDFMGAPAGGVCVTDLRIAGRVAELGGVTDVVNALKRFGNDSSQEEEGINVGEQGCAALWYLCETPGRLRELVKEAGGADVAKMVIRTQKHVECARTWGAKLFELLTGKDCSKYMRHVQVPGPSVYEDRIQEIKTDKWVCRPGCGCSDGEDGEEGGGGEAGGDESSSIPAVDDDDDGDEEEKKRDKRKRKRRLVFEKGGGSEGEGEGEGSDEDETVSSELEEQFRVEREIKHERDMVRSNNKQEKKRWDKNVKVFKNKDRKQAKALRAWEEKRHREKKMTVGEMQDAREAQGIFDDSDDDHLTMPQVAGG